MQKILRDASPSVRQTLLSQQIKSVASLMTFDAAKASVECDVDKNELQSVQQAVISQFSCFPLSGSNLLQDIMSSFFILPTGCDHWDELLDGGLYSGEVTEIVGSAGSGKTQDMNAILSRIKCFQTFDLFSLMGCLNDVTESLYREDDAFYNSLQLVVVDSVASVLTPVLGGQQITGHSMMVHLSRSLKSLAVQNGLAVLVTNNVVSDSKQSSTGGIKPALGPTWSHIPNTRIFIQKGVMPSNNKQSCERIATVTKSSRQPVQISTTFYIETAGVLDALLSPVNSQ